MDVLEKARERLARLCRRRAVPMQSRITVTCLSPDEAVGAKSAADLGVRTGVERMIEAKLGVDRGQAFTDQPSEWTGATEEMLALDLTDVRLRAVFVAGMNALLRSLGVATGTIHCRDEDPTRCGAELTSMLAREFGKLRVGLIGLQPAILAALTESFGPDLVRTVDLNPKNIGTEKSSVPVWDGRTDLSRLVDWCELGLATGSSIVNGSINEIIDRFKQVEKPLIFFGNTISGTAALLGLRRLCPFGR
jgi:hypothetical protein